jgi:hypothetical protein
MAVTLSCEFHCDIAKQVSDYPLHKYDGPVTINPVADFAEGNLIDYKEFNQTHVE